MVASGSAVWSDSVQRIWRSIECFGRLVKFSHSVFALPFALAMFALISRTHPVSWSQLGWIIVAVVSARTAAMAFNRLVDAEFDRRNPRTAQREIPKGEVSRPAAVALVALASAVFLGASAALGEHCLVLAPFVLAVLLGYSIAKRFTPLSHLILGLSLGCAPGGVWYALVGTIEVTPVWYMAAVLFWVAGFDIIYACQDEGFDRANGLRSIPAWLGTRGALRLSKLFHLLAVLLLCVFGAVIGVGIWYWAGVAVFAALLVSQHRLVSPTDLSKVDIAFFTRNGTASVAFFVLVLVDVVLG